MEEFNMTEHIYHVGILGMKWGRRKNNSSGEIKNKKSIFKNPEKVKKAAKITAAVLLGIGNMALSVYLAKKSAKAYNMNKTVDMVSKILSNHKESVIYL